MSFFSRSSLFSFFLLLLLLSFFLVSPAVARDRHVITITTQKFCPSSLAWDPSAQHFLVGSLLRPSISSVSDAGVIETLISDPLLPASSAVSALTVDNSHRRLLAAFSSPSLVAAYDLRSPRPHRRIFASPLPDPSAAPTGLTVDPTTGTAYVTGSAENKIWTLDLEGRVSELSVSAVGGGFGGVVHVSRGFLLAVEEGTGRVWKVRPEEGAAKEVLLNSRSPASAAVAVRSDGTAVVAGNRTARVLKSDDGWMEAVVLDEMAVEKGRVRGVAVREGRTVYLLVVPADEEEMGGVLGRGDGGYNGKDSYEKEKGKDSWGIEEIEWEGESGGEMVWGLVLLGLGLVYFMYWRFQMGQLVTNINKKRA